MKLEGIRFAGLVRPPWMCGLELWRKGRRLLSLPLLSIKPVFEGPEKAKQKIQDRIRSIPKNEALFDKNQWKIICKG